MFRSTRTLPRNLQTYTEQASTEELHTDLNNVGRQLFLHGSEMLQTHRQVNNDAAYGRFGDFALR